jgi:hypothetical protein
MSKELIVHFEGKDMPMSEWLKLIALRDAARRACNDPEPRPANGKSTQQDDCPF